MKIGDSSRPFLDQLGLRDDRQSISNRPQFQELFSASSEKLQRAELDQLMKQIDDLGRQLGKQLTWNALMNYRSQIKKFLETAVKSGFAIKNGTGRDRRGRTKLYKVVSQIDDLMAELTSLIIQEEKNELLILDKIGDLRGLLLNMYW